MIIHIKQLKYVFLFLFIATIFCDVMDTIIFHLDSWIMQWKYMHLITDWSSFEGFRNFADGWHLSKTFMQFSFTIAIFVGMKKGYDSLASLDWRFTIVLFGGSGLVYWFTHLLFFSLLFNF